MPIYRITAPNGKTYRIEGPPGASDADVARAVLAQFPEAGQAPQAPKEEDVGFLRRAADVPLGIAQGATMGFRLLADVFGADNPVSNSIRQAEDYLGELTSAAAQGNQKRMAEVMAEAEGKGVGEQVMIGLRAAKEAPIELATQAFGTSLPAILAAIASPVLAKPVLAARGATALQAANLLPKIRTGTQLATSGAMGVGAIKSAIYDAVKEELMQDMPEAQAEVIAREAQAYGGPNTDMIALGGALGVFAGKFGIEPAVVSAATQRAAGKLIGQTAAQQASKTAAPGIVSRTLTTGASEAATEFPQGFQERVAQNLALQREGFDVPTFEGAVAAGTLEGVAGFGAGAGAGAISGQPAPAQPVTPPTPEVETLPVTPEAPEVATLPPQRMAPGIFTEADVARIEPGAEQLPFVRNVVLGKTRSDLQAFIDENPEVMDNESTTARVIRALAQPAGEPDQLGMEPPVPVSGPAGLPDAAGAIPPVGSGVAGIGDDVGAPAVPTPSVTPTVTETPSGITTPEALEAEAQRQEEPIDTAEPVEDVSLPATPSDAWNQMGADVRLRAATQAGLANPENFTNKKWGSLSKTVRGKLENVIASEQMEVAEEVAPEAVAPRAPRVPREPREARIRATENPLNIGAPAGTRWQPGTVAETALVTEGAQPFRSRTEAREAKKTQPDMRVLAVPGGFVLTPKTETQIAADQRAGERLGRPRVGQKGRPLNAMEFIVDAGGLNRSAANNIQGVDVRRNPRFGNRFLITRNGMSLAQAAELLKQNGYIDDEFETSAAEAIGNPQAYTAEGNDRLMEIEKEARDREFDQDPYEDTGYGETTEQIKAEVDEILSRADELGIDPEDVYENARSRARVQAEWLGQREVTDYDYYLAAREEIRSVLARSAEDRSQDTGQPSEAAPDLELAPQSDESVAEAERRAAQAPAEQERDQIRRESEAGAGQFRLEGGEGRQDISGRLFQEEGRRVRFTHRTDTEPGKGQVSGFYPGTYAYEEGADTGPIPSRGGAKAFVGELNESEIYTLRDAEALKREAAQAGFEYRSASGNSEVEYLKSQGFKAMRRGPEIIVFDAKDAGFRQEGLFMEAEVEDSSGRKTQGLVREFDNGQGGTGVINLAISGNRIYPSYVDNGIMNRETRGSGGAVTSVYEDAIQEAQNRGLQFTSDSSVTMDAARVYDSLAKRGYKVNRNPSARIANRPEVVTQRWVTDDGSPVYTVDPKEGIGDAIEVDGKKRPTTNSSGRPIETSRERLQNFWRWFGNSKVTGADGKPLVVYHGTRSDFSVFDASKQDLRDGGFWFGAAKEASSYAASSRPGGSIIPVFLSIKNPKIYYNRDVKLTPEIIADLEKQGYDGVVRDFAAGPDSWRYGANAAPEWAAFRSEQIKSAIANVGSYDNEMSSILEARTEKGGWKIEPEEQRVEREIAGLDVDGLTQYAVDNAPNELAREVAQKIQARIRAMAKSGVEMSFTLYTGDRRPILMTNARGMVDYTITKDKPVQMSLKINGAAVIENQAGYPPGTRYETILHELLHMATAPQIAVAKDSQLVKDLNALRNQIVKHFNDKVKTGKLTDFEQKVYDRTINALSTTDEILAWGITDSDMQKFLADIKVGERSLFDKFVDIIQRVLGLGRSYRSALEDVIRTTDALLDIGVDQIAADTKKRGFMFGPANPRLEEGQIQGTLFQEETPIAKPDSVQGEGKAALNDSRNSILYKPVSGTWDIDPDFKEFGLSDEFFYNWVDKQVDLKRVVEAINATDKRVDSKFNAIEKERTFHGRVAERTRLYGENDLRPVVEMMAKFGLTQRDVGEYLLMRHVPEANRVIAERNPNFVKEPGTGYETATALKYMRDLDPQKKKQLEAVAKRMDQTLQKMQDMLIEYKIETPDTIQGWRDMYQFYIPLVREDGDFSVSKVMSQGAGYATAGDTSKARTGSKKAINIDQIFTNIALQHERMIVRAEKGRVAQSVFGLAASRPKPGFWLALDPETNVYWKTLKDLEQIKADRKNLKEMIDSGDLTKSQEAAFKLEIDLMNKIIRKRMEPARAAFAKVRDDLATGLDLTTEDATKMVEQLMIPPMKARYVKDKNTVVYEPNAAFNNEFVFTARINGSDKYVLFNGKDPRAARMVGALKNVDGESLSDTMNAVAMVTRYFAMINTQYNPVFGAYNFLRDVQTAALQISNTEIADKRKEVMNGTMPALSTIFKILRAERAGKNAEGKDVTEYNRFRLAGGQTGYRDQFSQTEQRAQAIQRLIDPSSWSESKMGNVFTAGGRLKVPMEAARKTLAPMFDLLSDYNQTLENAVRFSAFKVAKQKYLDQGMTLEDAEQKAAVISKEITVNFNQKGAKVNTIGALYAFFNASVQGTYMMAKTYAGPLGKRIIQGSLLWGSIQAMMLAMAGFEDDEPPEFVKQRNFIIPYGDGKYLAFPMPLGFNVLPTLSRLATEGVLTGGDKIPEKIVAALDAAMDMFNPIGNAGISSQTIAPTFLDPIVGLLENKDWTGQKIAREDFSGLNPTPGFTRSRESSTDIAKGLAEFLNTVSGGTEARRGFISPTADQLEYLIGQLTGGVGREAMKLGKTVEAQFTGEELPSYSVPLVGRFHGDVNQMASISSAFYRNLTDLNVHKREIESIRENKGDMQAYFRDNPEARLAQMAQAQYRQVQNLRKLRNEALKRDDKERAKKLEEQIKIRMQRLNERYKEMAK